MARPVDAPASMFALLRRSFGFLFGGIWLVVGLPFFITAVVMFASSYTLERDGLLTRAMVLSKDIRRSSSNGSTSTSYYVRYRFEAGGRTFEGSGQLGFDEWHALVERGPVDVLYRPSRPASNRLAAGRPTLLIAIFGLLGAVFSVVGGIVFGRAVSRARTEWALLNRGATAVGRVLSVGPSNLRLQGRQLWRLEYEFADGVGGTQRGHATIDPSEAEQWKAGDTGVVRFDVDRPRRSVWTGAHG